MSVRRAPYAQAWLRSGGGQRQERMCVFGVVLCAVTHLLLRNLLLGRFGRALLSLQADEIASSSVGVRVYRAKVMAFVVAAVTCGIAGALVAQQNQYINSDFITFNLSIFILLLVLFGGGSFWDVFPLGGFRPENWDSLDFFHKVTSQIYYMALPVFCSDPQCTQSTAWRRDVRE